MSVDDDGGGKVVGRDKSGRVMGWRVRAELWPLAMLAGFTR